VNGDGDSDRQVVEHPVDHVRGGLEPPPLHHTASDHSTNSKLRSTTRLRSGTHAGRADAVRGTLHWHTTIGIHDIGELPPGAVMAESDDRNTLGQGALSSRKPAHNHAE